MAGALGEFWAVKGHIGEGRRRVECALAADTSPTAARAKALNAAADLANGSGDRATARLRAEEGLALNRALGRTWGAADSLLVLGIAIIREGDFVRAQELIDEAFPCFASSVTSATRWRRRASRVGVRELGDLREARALLERNVRQAHLLDDKQVEARSLYALAGYALEDSRVEEAFRMLEDAYRLTRELGDLYWTPFIVCRFGHALAHAGKARSAAVVLSSGEALLDELGVGEQSISSENKDTLTVIHTQLDDDAFAKAWEQGRALTADQAVAVALDTNLDA
jgi:non-specific serine/threonine protein kinase